MYISQHKHPVSLQASGRYDHGGYQLLHAAIGETTVTRDGSSSGGDSHLEAGTVEFIHSLEAILGGICRSGLTITAFEEPCRADRWAPVGSPAHRACFAPPYFKVKATKPPA